MKTNDAMFAVYIKECIANNLKEKTIIGYKRGYSAICRLLPDIATGQFSSWNRARISEVKEALSNIDISAPSKNNYLRTLRAFLYWGMNNDYIVPFKVSLIREYETFKEPYSDAELRVLLRKPMVNDNEYEWRGWTIINFFIGTGIRCETLLNIKLCDIEIGKGYVITRHNKNGHVDSVKIGTRLRQAIILYQRHSMDTGSEWLFHNKRGGKMTTHSLQQAIRRYNNRRGVDKTSIHLFRHAFARRWAESGGDVFTLKHIFGHQDIKTTQRYINLYGTGAVERAMDRFNPLETL